MPQNTPGAKAVRLDFRELSEEEKLQVQEFKVDIAKLYDKVHLLSREELARPGLTNMESFQAYSRAQEHLQLASYYITHALTA